MKDWPHALLRFWFGLRPEQWWTADAELDAEVRERFEDLWRQERDQPPGAFLASADRALAATLLFDQFPRNMFRGHADQFSTDPLALAIARDATEQGLDQALPPERRAFLYMPFMHSEELAVQRRSVTLFTALGDPDKLDFARKHHQVIERFGRFPHRNQALGRRSTPEEEAFGLTPPW